MSTKKAQVNVHNQSPQNTTHQTIPLNGWNRDRSSEHQLDPIAVAYLLDPEITDRDRIAVALRELRKGGYDTEAPPTGCTNPLMIYSLPDSEGGFGNPAPSGLYRRLTRIAERVGMACDGP